ncbi:hypothetical protein C1H46_020670 [Malus baccata]|uniref:Uncharacterized protein n=1 Tax=Malus baccata TaxID=106549 RepID=A0A540M4Q6_MALBA|nr:hypothetical protein C1H46_020670 [Malus baccata]
MLDTNDSEATHVWLRFLYLPKLKQEGDICQVIFRFPKSANIKSCGVHLLLRNQNKRLLTSKKKKNKRLPLTLRPTRSLGKGRRRNMTGNNNGFPYLGSQRMIIGNAGRLTSMFLLTLRRRRRRRSKGNRPLHIR